MSVIEWLRSEFDLPLVLCGSRPAEPQSVDHSKWKDVNESIILGFIGPGADPYPGIMAFTCMS